MQNIAVLGLPRSGKSTLCSKMFAKIQHRCIFVNTQWENYFPEALRVDNWIKGKLMNYFSQNQKINLMLFKRNQIWDMLREIWYFQRSQIHCLPVTVFIDECHLFIPKHFNLFDESDDKAALLLEIFTLGLRFNLRLIIISQKPQFVCNDVFNLCESMIIFKLHPRDITYFKKHNIYLPLINEKYKYVIL